MKSIGLQQQIIYGPVASRRLGRSLGINLLPTGFKVCSMNCSYCQYGWTEKFLKDCEPSYDFFPSDAEILSALQNVFMQPHDFDYLTFSGNGEPTLHPGFPEIVESVLQMRSDFHSDVKLALLSNSTTCRDPKIKSAINKIDLPIMKLDAGNANMFKRINHGYPPIPFADIIKGLKSLKRFGIQTIFIRGAIDNSTDDEVGSWIETLERLNPLWVQIYSLDRRPANDNLKQVGKNRLEHIAETAQNATGIRMDVFS